MNEDRILENLAAGARASRAPLIDVTDRVLARVGQPAAAPSLLMWTVCAASSAAAAAAMLVAAVLVDTARQDPLTDIFASMMQVM